MIWKQNIDNLVLEGIICAEDAQLLTEALNELFYKVKNIGLTKNTKSNGPNKI